MSRSKGYLIYINKHSDYHWNMIVDMTKQPGLEFLCASITEDNEIQAYIRFVFNKTQSAVEKIFNHQVLATPVAHCEKFYKHELGKGINYFEYNPKHPQINNSQTDMLKLIVESYSKQMDAQNEFNQKLVDAVFQKINNNTTTNTNTNSHNTTNNTANTTNNTTNKNKINLQFFLNERCKDAMNMGEFARTVPINLDDILYFKNHSHCEGITRIIENGLNQMDITQRPIHCTDPKRETLHIKEDGKWINDQKKEVIGKAIQTVVSRSFNGMSLWKTANPEYNYDNEMKTEYAILMKKLLGGNNEEENKEKIIRNMCRISHLDRGNVVSPYNPLPII